jgi:hypothetical protein
MSEQTRPELEAEINSDLDENWLPLLKTDGQWDEQKIRNELHDLVFIYHQVAEVYEYITRGKLSKPMYYADVIKQQFDEAINEAVKDAMADRLEEVGFLERQHAASQERDDWKRIVDQNLAASDETVATMARELGAAREERDVFLGGLQSAQALIVTWATWLRATFPKELEVGDEEQAMLDYAAALAAEGETPA